MAKNLWIILSIIAVLAIGGAVLFMQKQNLNNQPANTPDSQSNKPSSEISNTDNIEIDNFAFSPSVLNIKQGETVTWINNDDAPHTVTSDADNELNSGTLSKGESYIHTFNEIGVFDYHCRIHPLMKAKVIVG